ncbi:hypothetical protein BH09ACT11_BH09ACT11_03860 [soil metagenome]
MDTNPIQVSSPVRVRDRLASSSDRPLPVIARSNQAIYLDAGGWCVGLIAPSAVRVPNALVTGEPLDFSTFEVRSGVLHADGRPARITRLTSHRVPRLTGLNTSPTPPVVRLIGSGDGMTPYGDDVLCGWLGIQRAAGRPTPRVDQLIRINLPNTSLLSATLLECAMTGEVIEEFAEFVSALGTTLERSAVAALKQVGGSSGVGMLEGARLALRRWSGRVAA